MKYETFEKTLKEAEEREIRLHDPIIIPRWLYDRAMSSEDPWLEIMKALRHE